jgi:serine/threonine protein kinase/tetratricopeptide (TPR) repeat protein
MPDTQPIRVRFGVFELDLRAGELCLGELKIVLQDQPFQILQMLVRQAGEVITREEIQKQLWPVDTIVAFDLGINQAIRRLRRALNDSAEKPAYIETVARRGYRLKVPVEAVDRPPDPAVLTGKQVSHYRVLEVIGGGGMGVVYRAEDLRLGRAVALKFLPVEVGNDSRALERFEREARAASALDHPNICSIYELEEYEGKPFIVMQLLEGRTLRDWLASSTEKEKALALKQLLDIAMQVAEGLQAAHDKGIIHRDIKPANIFLTKKGIAKILDFSLAKLAELREEGVEADLGEEDVTGAGAAAASAQEEEPAEFVSAPLMAAAGSASAIVLPSPAIWRFWRWRRQTREVLRPNSVADFSDNGCPSNGSGSIGFTTAVANAGDGGTGLHLTRTGFAFGTAAYMSPEQIRGDKLDTRTDIFSFGSVLYEMFTGQRAFSGDTAAIVHDAILNQIPRPAHEVNSAIPPRLEQIIDRAIEKERELRYQSVAEMRADLETVADRSSESDDDSRKRSPWKWLPVAAVVCVAIVAGGLYWWSHRPAKLTDQDTIVLADFDNKTGDPIFDDSLKQGLSVQLGQSPFLNVLPNRKVRGVLKLMNRSASDRLTEDVAREICLRTGSKAVLNGSIARFGSEFVIGLNAVNCNTGDLLAQAQAQAASKEAVLNALDAAANQLRSELGESLTSVQRYATPLAEATTPSLEALKALSMGNQVGSTKGWTASLPFYKRAVELDPNFAMAYLRLATTYGNLNEGGLAKENARRAYELRDKVSERERFNIDAIYYTDVTGDLEKAVETYELWQQNYPRDVVPHGNLGTICCELGNLQKCLEESQQAVRMEPNVATVYTNLADAYENLNRLDEAEKVYEQAEQRKLGDEGQLADRYALAFLKGDTAQMAKMASAATGKLGTEDLLLASQADTAAWYGKFKTARDLTRQAMDSAGRNDAGETAASYAAAAALREVAAGNLEQARTDSHAALKLDQSRNVRAMAALALALAGDTAEAENLASELDKEYPLGTLVQSYWLPTIRAAVALERNDPNRAIELLNLGAIEVGMTGARATVYMCPVYLRGEAYLMLHDGKAAAAEFQKFIDHYGLVVNFPWGALARLGLARAYALEAATDPAARDKARTAYQNFLTLWKDADPDIPIYKQAKAEYARLK